MAGWMFPCDDSYILVPIRARLLMPETCHMGELMDDHTHMTTPQCFVIAASQ